MTRKVGHTDLVFGVRSGFISRSVYARVTTSLRVAVTICATLVMGTHRHARTHTQTVLDQLIRKAQPADPIIIIIIID